MTALTTPEQINLYRLCTLRTGLKLEIKGMQMSRGRSCYAILKAEGYKGTKQRILDKVIQDIKELKIQNLIGSGMSRSDAEYTANWLEAEQLTA